jgi:hypothetical protein
MSPFIKLTNGTILFVTEISNEQGILYGYNLASPTLRINSYSQSQIDTNWKEKGLEIEAVFYLTKHTLTDCKYHPSCVTEVREVEINRAILQLLGMEERAKAIVTTSIY